MVINHLLNGMILQVPGPGNQKTYPNMGSWETHRLKMAGFSKGISVSSQEGKHGVVWRFQSLKHWNSWVSNWPNDIIESDFFGSSERDPKSFVLKGLDFKGWRVLQSFNLYSLVPWWTTIKSHYFGEIDHQTTNLRENYHQILAFVGEYVWFTHFPSASK